MSPMGDGGGTAAGGGLIQPTLELTAEDALHQPLPDNIPPEMFTGPGLLALADLLPVMTAFVGRDEVYRFVNKPYSDWIGLPRKQMLGMTMRALLGAANYGARKPMIDAALRGERQFFASTYDHPERGTLALQIDYVPWIAPGGAKPEGIVRCHRICSDGRVRDSAIFSITYEEWPQVKERLPALAEGR